MAVLDELLRLMTERGASDLHLKPTRPPLIRVSGRLHALEADALKPEEIQAMLDPVLKPHQRRKLEERQSVDFGYGVHGLARFRANVYYQRGTLAGVSASPTRSATSRRSTCRRFCSTSATFRWAWCWSRARPAAASRRRSRR
jgi:Tfp pilus assembly pilus retraction ATPase PilT